MKKQSTNFNAVKAIIKGFSGQDNVLAIPKPFIKFMGNVTGGLFLSQLLFWSDKGKDPGGWFYKSYPEWEEDACLSKYQVSKWAGECEKMGFLLTKVKKANGFPTVHYRVDMDKFTQAFLNFIQKSDSKETSLSEIGKSRNLTIDSEETSLSDSEETSLSITETTRDHNREGGELKNSPAAPVEIAFDDLQSASSQNGQNGHTDNSHPSKSLTEMDRAEAERFLTFEAGRTPGAESDPAIENAEAAFQRSGWEIRCRDVSVEAVQDAVIYFAAATGYDIPNDTGIRNFWIKALKTHVQEVPLHELYRLYKDTFIQMKSGKNPLTVSDPNSLTKTLLDNWQQKKSKIDDKDPMTFYLKIRGNYPDDRFAIMAVQDKFGFERWEPVNV